jgi:flagellar protein FliO/FliZ
VRGAITLLLLILPSQACADGLLGQEHSLLSSFVQMIAALSIVIGLILVTRHFSEKLIKGGIADKFASRHIRLVETRAIAPKRSLVLIEVGGEYLLLGNSEHGLSLLKRVELFEEIEVLENDDGARPHVFGLFRRNADKRRN